ncbi:MAG: hypothetical protein IT262_15350 [Saprospiraceae bacterium]|nr:hypothetical protein [Saprospiraceae bacterium]
MPFFHKIAAKTARSQVRAALAQGNIAEAIRLLLQTGSDEAAILQEQFAASGQQRALGLISPEEWGRVQMQLCTAILELDWMKESAAPIPITSEVKTQLLQLLEQRQTEQALVLCTDMGDDFLLLQMQLNLARNQSARSLMEAEYWEVTKSKINYTLQEMLAEVPDEQPPKVGLWGKIRRLLG